MAQSLNVVHRLHIAHGLSLWEHYNLAIVNSGLWSRAVRFDFDLAADDTSYRNQFVEQFQSLTGTRATAREIAAAQRVWTPALRRESVEGSQARRFLTVSQRDLWDYVRESRKRKHSKGRPVQAMGPTSALVLDLEGSRRSLGDRLHVTEARMSSLLNSVGVLEGRIAASVAERDGLVAERDAVGVEVERLSAQLEGLRGELDETVSVLAGVSAERDGLVAERDGLVAERDAVGVEVERLSAQLEGLRGELDGAVSGRVRVESVLAAVSAMGDQMRDELQVSRQLVSSQDDLLNGLSSELVSSQADRSFKESQLRAIAESESWRLGRAITWLPRFIAGRTGKSNAGTPPASTDASELMGYVVHDHSLEDELSLPVGQTDDIVKDQFRGVTATESPGSAALELEGTSAIVQPGPSSATQDESIEARYGSASLAAFDERQYLRLYPDVASAVEQGALPSGLHHFIYHGHSEGRLGPGFRPFARRAPRSPGGQTAESILTLVGPLSAPSGLGRSARGFALAASSAGLQPEIVDIDPYVRGADSDALTQAHEGLTLPPAEFRLWVVNGDVFPRLFRIVDLEALDDVVSIGVWVWELNSLPPDWIPSLGGLDEVWAPSQFCANAIALQTCVPTRVVPYVVEIDRDGLTRNRSAFGIPEDAFVFLYVFDSASYLQRKNPEALVRAFEEAFAGQEDVLLILKCQVPREASSELDDLRASIRSPRIWLWVEDFDDDSNYSLKNVCDCFVSPHRAEGFGLNVAEAMLLGKAVIATDYSATRDFVNTRNAYPLRYQLATVGRDMGPYPAGAVWAEPDHDHLKTLLRHVHANPEEATQKGGEAARTISERFSRQRVGEVMRQALFDLRADSVSPEMNARVEANRLLAYSYPAVDMEHLGAELSDLPSSSGSRISIVVPVFNIGRDLLERCVSSVLAQTYPNWELCLCDDGSTDQSTLEYLAELRNLDPRIRVAQFPDNRGISAAMNRAVEISTGEYVAFLDNDDELAPRAMEEVIRAATLNPSAEFFYSDEDKIAPDGSLVDAYFKPDWSPEHLESCMYVLHLMVVKKGLFLELGGFREEFSGAQDYDLALRLSNYGAQVVHIPKILYHWRMIAGSSAEIVDAKPVALNRAKEALADYATTRFGDEAWVEAGKLPGLWRVRVPRPSLPRVTLVILTNDGIAHVPGRGQVSLLENLLTSIRKSTDESQYEVLVVDNGNINTSRRQLLGLAPNELASYGGSQVSFNFSDKANYAVSQVASEVFVLMNDDLEVVSHDWLASLTELAVRPEVGVVGAKLVFPTGAIQHVGVVGGVLGATAHVYHGSPGDLVGYNGFPNIIRNYSMVTGACMASRRDVVARIGGFDTRFARDFNDVDFCLRAVSAGYRVVYTPFAELVHFESQTIKRDRVDDAERQAFIGKWKWSRFLSDDPYFNPNFSKRHVDFRSQ
ncbi:MAG: glycosyltransferase [Candidatus Nanopelagicales bacterium]